MKTPHLGNVKAPPDPEPGLQLGLDGMLGHKKFPNRTTLTITEVAKVLEIDGKHLCDLIREGLIGAIEITGKTNASSRERWKIPVECYDDYIRLRSNIAGGKG